MGPNFEHDDAGIAPGNRELLGPNLRISRGILFEVLEGPEREGFG